MPDRAELGDVAAEEQGDRPVDDDAQLPREGAAGTGGTSACRPSRGSRAARRHDVRDRQRPSVATWPSLRVEYGRTSPRELRMIAAPASARAATWADQADRRRRIRDARAVAERPSPLGALDLRRRADRDAPRSSSGAEARRRPSAALRCRRCGGAREDALTAGEHRRVRLDRLEAWSGCGSRSRDGRGIPAA